MRAVSGDAYGVIRGYIASLLGILPADHHGLRRAACLAFSIGSLPFEFLPVLLVSRQKLAERRNVALLEAGSLGSVKLVAAWSSDGGQHWALSPVADLGSSYAVSTSFGRDSAVGVALSNGSGQTQSEQRPSRQSSTPARQPQRRRRFVNSQGRSSY